MKNTKTEIEKERKIDEWMNECMHVLFFFFFLSSRTPFFFLLLFNVSFFSVFFSRWKGPLVFLFFPISEMSPRNRTCCHGSFLRTYTSYTCLWTCRKTFIYFFVYTCLRLSLSPSVYIGRERERNRAESALKASHYCCVSRYRCVNVERDLERGVRWLGEEDLARIALPMCCCCACCLPIQSICEEEERWRCLVYPLVRLSLSIDKQINR